MKPIPMKTNPRKKVGAECVAVAAKTPSIIPINHTRRSNPVGGTPYFTVARHVLQT